MLSQNINQQIQYWPIERFTPYDRHLRKSDRAVNRIRASIREFGFKIPVVARSCGIVVDGELRIKGAQEEKSWPGGDITRIPVILCDEWTDIQVRAFRLIVNQSARWAEWDEAALAEELRELGELDYDLSLTGFDTRELNRLVNSDFDEDKAEQYPELREAGYLQELPES